MSGDGDGQYITRPEFSTTVTEIKDIIKTLASKKDIEKLNDALWGEDGRSGMVRDVNTLINRKEISNKILVFAASIVGSILTALIMAVLL